MDIFFVITYLGGLLAYGIWQGFRVKNARDFAVTTSRPGLYVVVASLSASFIGGGFSAGNATEVFRYGIGNIVALFGFSLGQIVIGCALVSRSTFPTGCSSPGMILRAQYGRVGQAVAGLCTILLCIGLLGAQVAAIGGIFNVLLHVPYALGVLIGFSVVLVYSTAGGMNAVLGAEMVEFVLLIVGLPLLLAGSLRHAGGLAQVVEKIPPEHFSVFNGRGPVGLLSLFLTMMIGEALTPPFIQRMLIGRDIPTVARGTALSGLISIPVFIITGAVGLCAYAIDSTIDPTLAMPAMVMQALPVGIKGLVMTTMLAVVMSSADGVLASASIGLVSDILAPLSRRPMASRTMLRTVRISNLLLGILGMLIALWSKNPFEILVLAYSAWSPMVLVPIAAAMLGYRSSKRRFVASALAGALFSISWTLLGNPWSINGASIGFAASLLIFVTGKKLARA